MNKLFKMLFGTKLVSDKEYIVKVNKGCYKGQTLKMFWIGYKKVFMGLEPHNQATVWRNECEVICPCCS